MGKETYCWFPLVSFCLRFCLEDYRIVLNFCCLCYSLKMVIYSEYYENILCDSFSLWFSADHQCFFLKGCGWWSPIWISEIDKNDNVTSDNNEDGPWPKGTVCIAGDSILSGLQPGLLSWKRKVEGKSFSGTNVWDMHDNIKPILRHKPE